MVYTREAYDICTQVGIMRRLQRQGIGYVGYLMKINIFLS